MSFLNILFLWGLASISIPILIALWNRNRQKREDFGGFFLLRRMLEATQKRIRLLELIKLLNRIALLTLLVGIFAEPLKKEMRYEGAGEGFALILDTGRMMQGKSGEGYLSDLQLEKALSFLKKFPESAQGVVLTVSDRCEALKIEGQQVTATSDKWIEYLSAQALPYSNATTTSEGFSACLSQIQVLFQKKKPLTVFISPLPKTLEANLLTRSKIQIEKLPEVKVPEVVPFNIQQDVSTERIRLSIRPMMTREAKLIREGRIESLGEVLDFLDLPTQNDSWVVFKKTHENDPWVDAQIVPLQSQKLHQVMVWAQKETPGYLSLVTALRNHPDLKVIRQVGNEPSGSPLIVYGSFPFSLESLGQTWFFIDSQGQNPFKARDQKQWSAAVSSSDVSRSFHIQTQDGEVFVKRYTLFDLDRFDILESFQDGAPSLLVDRTRRERTWVSPFDLEDLTTDLSLEPIFIPYLYRKIDKWLNQNQSGAEAIQLNPIWLMPSHIQPTQNIISTYRWPGVYGNGGEYKIVQPSPIAREFLNLTSKAEDLKMKEEEISLRPQLLQFLILSIFIELILCLLGARWVIAFVLISFSLFGPNSNDLYGAVGATRFIPIGYLKGIDPDRKLALEQIVQEIGRLSNLEFSKPQEVSPQSFWQYSVIVGSSSRPITSFTKEEREKIRDYCERGGLLVFDDPLAQTDSLFYQSIKKELSEIFPGRPLRSIPTEDVTFRTYYLLSEVSGRKLSSPKIEGLDLDSRWVAYFSFNDLLGSQLKSASGDYAFSVSPYGIQQRILAKRLFLNFLMYSVTVNYKDDAIHLPHILKRRVK